MSKTCITTCRDGRWVETTLIKGRRALQPGRHPRPLGREYAAEGHSSAGWRLVRKMEKTLGIAPWALPPNQNDVIRKVAKS